MNLTKSIIECLHFFGVQNAEEIQAHLKLRREEYPLQDIKQYLIFMEKNGLIKKSDQEGYYK